MARLGRLRKNPIRREAGVSTPAKNQQNSQGFTGHGKTHLGEGYGL
jgi:hypothetical protein